MKPHGGHILGAAPNRLGWSPLSAAPDNSPQQWLLDLARIQAMSGIGPLFVPEQYAPGTSTPLMYEDSAGTTPAVVGGVVGRWLSLTGGIAATQATTSNKPTLKVSDSGIRWLSPPASGNLTVALPAPITHAVVFEAKPEGVVETVGVNLGASFNLLAPGKWRSAYIVIDVAVHGAVTPVERAMITRFLGRYTPKFTGVYAFAINQTGGGLVDLRIKTEYGSDVDIDWGDGTRVVVASNTLTSRTYPAAYSGVVTVRTTSPIVEWYSANGKWNFDWSATPSSLTYFYCSGSNTLSGTLSLPSSLTYFYCAGNNTLSGTLTMPSGMTSFSCAGYNTLSGTLSLPSSLTYFYCAGTNTLSGTLTMPSSLTYFYCTGTNTLSGTLSLPSGMTTFSCTGSNTLSGTLTMPSGMTSFSCTGTNTLSGTLTMPSGMTYFYCSGSNTLSGTLAVPSGMTYFYCTGSNTLSGYSSSAKASNQQRFYIAPVSPGGLSAANVDQILIDYAAAGGTWSSPKEVYIKGTCAPRTAASDAAVAALQAKGVAVATN